MNPDIKYDDIITPLYLANGEMWEGGIRTGILNPDSMAYNTLYHMGRVIEVSFSDFDPDVHTSEYTGLQKKALTFSNGAYIAVRAWTTSNQVNGPIRVLVLAYNSDDTLNGAIYTNFLLLGSKAPDISYSCWPEDFKEHGVKLFFVTDYYDVWQGPVMNVTPPYRMTIFLAAPLRAYSGGHAAYHNECGQVVSFSTVETFGYTIPGMEELGEVNPFIITVSDILDVYAFMEALGYDNPEDGAGIGKPIEDYNPDPPQDDDPSGPGGGDGNYDDESDPIDFPDLPTRGALSTGAIKAFMVDVQHITGVFTKLWNTNIFDIASFQKLLEAPLDSLIELVCLPCVPSVGGQQAIKLGNFDTEVTAPVVTNQYLTVDCGSLQVKKYWGSALDYDPYTKVEIFLPFIGIKQLQTEDVMGSNIHVKYNIDCLTGDLTAQLKVGQSVLYKYTGNCKATVPVSARVSEALENLVKGAQSIALGAAVGNTAGAASMAISTAVNVALAKTRVSRSGDISGATGLLDDFVPYLIIHRPVQSLPTNYRNFKGYTSNISSLLSRLRGYTEVEYIHLTGINGATDTELREIESLLKAGVII